MLKTIQSHNYEIGDTVYISNHGINYDLIEKNPVIYLLANLFKRVFIY